MSLTHGGALSVRSQKLKQADAALEQYHRRPDDTALGALRTALVQWMGDKGSDWRGSVRNGRGAVSRLQRELGLAGDPGGAGEALEALRREPQRLMNEIFHGAEITWKNEFRGRLSLELVKPWSDGFGPEVVVKQYAASASTNKVGLAGNAAAAAAASKTLSQVRASPGAGSDPAGTVKEAIGKLVSQVVPPAFQREVLGQVMVLVPGFMPQLIAAVTPVAGTLTAAGTTLWNAGNAVHKQVGIHRTEQHLARSMAGDTVTQAVGALVRILERERNADIYAAGVSLTEFGGKLAGTLLDGGTATTTAIGLAANIAKLLNIVRIVYRDVQEKNAANRMLRVGSIGVHTFETCPLLGCYVVCCLPTSALMTLIADHHGQRGWMDLAESIATEHLAPLREKARSTLEGHRFEIRKLARFPGMLKVNEKELKRMKANVGKSGYEGIRGPA